MELRVEPVEGFDVDERIEEVDPPAHEPAARRRFGFEQRAERTEVQRDVLDSSVGSPGSRFRDETLVHSVRGVTTTGHDVEAEAGAASSLEVALERDRTLTMVRHEDDRAWIGAVEQVV